MSLDRLIPPEGQIMKLRALGYSQEEIAERLNITQSAVSQRIGTIRRRAERIGNDDNAFWQSLLGLGAIYVLLRLLDEEGG